MKKEDVGSIIFNIFSERFKVEKSKLIPQNYSEPLTGPIFKFDSFMLTYLFFDIQKSFKICISANEILHYEFNSISSITRIVLKHVI